MGFATKTAVKANFQDGDRPNQDAYDDFIDSAVFFEADSLGIYEVIATASSTARSRSIPGLQIIKASSRNDIYSLIGLTIGGSAGLRIIEEVSAQPALSTMSVPSFGAILIQSSATSSAIGFLGGATAGIQLAGVSTTSQANTFLDNLESVFLTALSTGSAGSSAKDPNAFREFEIDLPSAATQIESVEIILRMHPSNSPAGQALFMQMRRPGADYDTHASAYQTITKIADTMITPTIQQTAALASAVYVAWTANSSIGFTQSQTTPGAFGVLRVENFNSTGRRTTMTYEGIGHRSGFNQTQIYHSHAIHNTAAVVDQIRVYFSNQGSASYAEARIYAQGT